MCIRAREQSAAFFLKVVSKYDSFTFIIFDWIV